MTSESTRYVMRFEYNGSGFCGFQRQRSYGAPLPGVPSIQEEIENALKIILRHDVGIIGSGRTDSGVHALCQYAHFDTSIDIDCGRVVYGINHYLQPKGISIANIQPVPPEFHARFSAIRRHYRYIILNRQHPAVVQHLQAWHVAVPLNVARMHKAAQQLVGNHDFSSFRCKDCQAKSPYRTLEKFQVTAKNDCIYFDLCAPAFLHQQVRIMVGTLKRLGQYNLPDTYITDILQQRKRQVAGPTAPPHGLFFMNTDYPAHFSFSP